jgi:hypothetical protein
MAKNRSYSSRRAWLRKVYSFCRARANYVMRVEVEVVFKESERK